MQKITITLPVDDFSLMEFSQDDKAGLMIINAALKDFEFQHCFSWHLSLRIVFKNTVADNMPSKSEQEALMKFEEQLDEQIKKDNNALFLASITHDGSRELIWRVYNPEVANDYLHDLIESGDHSHPFEFSLEQDITWAKAKFPLDSLDGELTEDTTALR